MRTKLFGPLLALTILGDHSAVAADNSGQFNLICTGSVQTLSKGGFFGADRGQSTPWTGSIRVDLDASEFCLDNCDEVQNIASTSPEKILFIDHLDELRTFSDHTEITDQLVIDRRTGEYERYHVWLDTSNSPTIIHHDNYRAVCTRGDFTEFPKKVF